MSGDHLQWMYDQADAIDIREGQLAYIRYHKVMAEISDTYNVSLRKVIAGFVSLSPNNDYISNLRSLITVLKGIKHGTPLDQITVSTYKHCRNRAYAYMTGAADFEQQTKGPKIWNFYHNLIDPKDVRWVTVDGHMVAAWRNDLKMVMKDAIPKAREYQEIKQAIQSLAFKMFMVPNQLQAILWFTRKKLANRKYSAQMSMQGWASNDQWETVQNITSLKGYDYHGENEKYSRAKIWEIDSYKTFKGTVGGEQLHLDL